MYEISPILPTVPGAADDVFEVILEARIYTHMKYRNHGQPVRKRKV